VRAWSTTPLGRAPSEERTLPRTRTPAERSKSRSTVSPAGARKSVTERRVTTLESNSMLSPSSGGRPRNSKLRSRSTLPARANMSRQREDQPLARTVFPTNSLARASVPGPSFRRPRRAPPRNGSSTGGSLRVDRRTVRGLSKNRCSASTSSRPVVVPGAKATLKLPSGSTLTRCISRFLNLRPRATTSTTSPRGVSAGNTTRPSIHSPCFSSASARVACCRRSLSVSGVDWRGGPCGAVSPRASSGAAREVAVGVSPSASSSPGPRSAALEDDSRRDIHATAPRPATRSSSKAGSSFEERGFTGEVGAG
jgi:hypothetical protein